VDLNKLLKENESVTICLIFFLFNPQLIIHRVMQSRKIISDIYSSFLPGLLKPEKIVIVIKNQNYF